MVRLLSPAFSASVRIKASEGFKTEDVTTVVIRALQDSCKMIPVCL